MKVILNGLMAILIITSIGILVSPIISMACRNHLIRFRASSINLSIHINLQTTNFLTNHNDFIMASSGIIFVYQFFDTILWITKSNKSWKS